MSAAEEIREASLEECVVLLGAVVASTDRETPVNAAELRQVCNERLEASKAPVVGGLSEADVTRALYSLESAGLVENVAQEDTSATGKGRPAYEVVPDAETIRATLADHDDLTPLIDALED